MLHGRMNSKKTWKKFAPEIAKRTQREVYIYDARNHGDSYWDDEMDLDILTEDLEEFMNDFDMEQAILIGHSMGGKTALTFALKKPEAVEKLIVEDMDTKDYPEFAKHAHLGKLNIMRESLTAIPANADEMTARKAVLKFLQEKLNPDPKQPRKSPTYSLEELPIRKEGNSYVWQANLDILEDTFLKDKFNKKLSGVYNGKSLFLYGKKSFFNVERDEDINKFFPQAIKVGIEGAGHMIHQEFPGEFLNHVTSFILKS
ncbi:hypothetical protein TNCT_230621 [Trichonephila clavata]|uniref:sn-1-specific diacylglycerol lipase ABHD11 n=1 Tax=Trichonephila clavata TaxID=2740835 RepID=A0A8X6GJE5_TRICU|nr:hypothetical protein TNCT_230621 [Trichonephila clavata]